MKLPRTHTKEIPDLRHLAIKEAIYCYSDGAFAAGDRLVELFAWLNGFVEFETTPMLYKVTKDGLRGSRLSDFDGDEI